MTRTINDFYTSKQLSPVKEPLYPNENSKKNSPFQKKKKTQYEHTFTNTSTEIKNKKAPTGTEEEDNYIRLEPTKF